MLSVLGCLVLAYRRPHLAFASDFGMLTVRSLVINSMYWLLPLPYAMYPERVSLPVVASPLGIGVPLDGVRRLVPRRDHLLWGMAAVVAFVAIRQNEKLFHKGLIRHALMAE